MKAPIPNLQRLVTTSVMQNLIDGQLVKEKVTEPKMLRIKLDLLKKMLKIECGQLVRV